MVNNINNKWLIAVVTVIIVIVVGMFLWVRYQMSEKSECFSSGNGCIEATEIDIATKYQGRITDILCREGDFLEAG